MAVSGIKLEEECKFRYDEIQKKHLHRFVTFQIKDDRIQVDKVKPYIKTA